MVSSPSYMPLFLEAIFADERSEMLQRFLAAIGNEVEIFFLYARQRIKKELTTC